MIETSIGACISNSTINLLHTHYLNVLLETGSADAYGANAAIGIKQAHAWLELCFVNRF